MDTFEILSEIYKTVDESMADGLEFKDAMTTAEQEISKKYHIAYQSVKKMVENH